MDPSFHHRIGIFQVASSFPGEDDGSVITPNRGGKAKTNEKSCVEITLKFRFVPSRDKDNIHPAILHNNWMQEVLTAFGSGKIQFR